MGAKVWGTAAVVIAAAAAAGAGIITWEGRVLGRTRSGSRKLQGGSGKDGYLYGDGSYVENARLYGGSGTPQWPQNGLAGRC